MEFGTDRVGSGVVLVGAPVRLVEQIVAEDGGIEIHIAAEQPQGVPVENWLPINRGDEVLDLVMRIYAPDLERMKSWEVPKAVLKK